MSPDRSVLFLNQHYWPDVASTGQHLTDVAEHLAASGFGVAVLCGRAHYMGGELSAPVREVRNGVAILRVGVPGYGRGRLSGRAADYAAYHLRAGLRTLIGSRPDLVVSLTTPSLLPATVRTACAARGVPYGIWAMDIHPDVEDRLGLLPGGRALAGPLHAASWAGYRGARFVVALGPRMAREVAAKGVPENRIHQIPVWSCGEEIRPVAPAENPLRAELGVGSDDLVVLYSGNAGLAHRFDEVIDAMERLRDEPSIHFLFVGGGPRRAEIEREARRRRLPRFRYLDYFPRDQLATSLSAGDLHLFTLRDDMAGLVAPSKLYGSMAAGRPVLMVGPADSDPGIVIREERVGQVIAPGPNGGERLAALIRAYGESPRLREEQGRRARSAFLSKYERAVCCRAWTELLRDTLTTTRAAGSDFVEPVGLAR